MKIRISKIINQIRDTDDLQNLLKKLRQHDWIDNEGFEEIISNVNRRSKILDVFDLNKLSGDRIQDYVDMLLQAIDDDFPMEFRCFLLNYEYVVSKVIKKMKIKWD